MTLSSKEKKERIKLVLKDIERRKYAILENIEDAFKKLEDLINGL